MIEYDDGFVVMEGYSDADIDGADLLPGEFPDAPPLSDGVWTRLVSSAVSHDQDVAPDSDPTGDGAVSDDPTLDGSDSDDVLVSTDPPDDQWDDADPGDMSVDGDGTDHD